MTAHDCAVCTRPAFIFCESCAKFDDTGVPLDDARWYCTSLCQDIDRLTHNNSCTIMASDKELFERAKQAGEAVQALFFTFIEYTWAYDMNSVRVTPGSNGELLAVEVIHGSNTDTSTCERTAGDWLIKFPHEAFSPADERAKCALLADRHSVWAFAVMHVAVRLLFEGMRFCSCYNSQLIPRCRSGRESRTRRQRSRTLPSKPCMARR